MTHRPDVLDLSEEAVQRAFVDHVSKTFHVLLQGENFNSDPKFAEAIGRFMRSFNNGLRAYIAIVDQLNDRSEGDSA